MNTRRLILLSMLLLLISTLFAADPSFLSTLSENERTLLAQQAPLSLLVDPAWEPLEYLDRMACLQA